MRKNQGRSPDPIAGVDVKTGLLIFLLLALAVALGLSLPYLVTSIQGSRIDRTNELVDLGAGALSLDSDEMKLERLELIASIASETTIESAHAVDMEISSGRFMDSEKAAAMLPDILALAQGTGLYCYDFNERHFNRATPALLVSEDYGSSIIVWAVSYSADDGENIYSLDYCVDDASGIILAVFYYVGRYAGVVDENMNTEPYTRQSLQRLAENLADSYDFSDTQVRFTMPEEQAESEQREYDQPTLESDIFYSNYAIDFVKDGQTVYSMPVAVSIDSWSINWA